MVRSFISRVFQARVDALSIEAHVLIPRSNRNETSTNRTSSCLFPSFQPTEQKKKKKRENGRDSKGFPFVSSKAPVSLFESIGTIFSFTKPPTPPRNKIKNKKKNESRFVFSSLLLPREFFLAFLFQPWDPNPERDRDTQRERERERNCFDRKLRETRTNHGRIGRRDRSSHVRTWIFG